MSPPGWYPDPHGPAGSYRWWDGSAWTAQVTMGSPTVEAPPTPPAPPSPPAPPTSATPLWAPTPPAGPPQWVPAGPSPSPTPRRRLPLIIAGAAALVLLVAAGLFVASRGGDEEATVPPDDESQADETTVPPTDEEQEPAPDPDAISIGVLSYQPLGGEWTEFESSSPEFPGGVGQAQVTQDDAPTSGGEWIANVVIGFLDPTIPYTGTNDLEAAARTLADTIINGGVYYPEGTTSEIVVAEARQVDGHEAFVVRAELRFAVPGLTATGETVQLAVIDTGVLPAAFWGSIPNNVPELVADMDAAFASLSVEE